MKSKEVESEALYAFFHLYDRDVWSTRQVEVRTGDGNTQTVPSKESPIYIEELARLLAQGEELSTNYIPVFMLRRRELGELLRRIGGNQVTPQEVADLTNKVFENYTKPESSSGELAFYGLHLFPSLDGIFDLNPPVPVTNMTHSDFVSYKEEVALQDIARTLKTITHSHSKQPVLNVRLEHIANGELSKLFDKMGVSFPPLC